MNIDELFPCFYFLDDLCRLHFLVDVSIFATNDDEKTLKKKQTLWPLFTDEVQLPQGYSHFEEAVYFDRGKKSILQVFLKDFT